jgi:CsoR family transcriptional regulator, copper-sensing transcriptional repressor
MGYQKDALLTRLNRIEGQVRGLARMVDEEKYCVDVLTQISAVRAALDKVALGVLDDHIKTCVADAAGSDQAEQKLSELAEVIERFVALRK